MEKSEVSVSELLWKSSGSGVWVIIKMKSNCEEAEQLQR